jgi:hypothetical protein
MPLVLLRYLPMGTQSQCYGNAPIRLDVNHASYEWVSTDWDIRRLKARARLDCKSYSDTSASDYVVCLLAYGTLLPLGPLFPDERPQRQVCVRCKEPKPLRAFESRDRQRLTTWGTHTGRICSTCKSKYVVSRPKQDDRTAKREAIARVLLTDYMWSDAYIGKELLQREGFTTGGRLVSEVRAQLEHEGKIPKTRYRCRRDGRVYRVSQS